jgi:hypothetical protein
MSCCGKKRQAYRAFLQPRPVRLRFLGTGTIELKGTQTGKAYVVSKDIREIDVDPRDAAGLLQGGRFNRA